MEMYLAMISTYQSKAKWYAASARRVRQQIMDEPIGVGHKFVLSIAMAEYNYYSSRSAEYATKARHMVMELINK